MVYRSVTKYCKNIRNVIFILIFSVFLMLKYYRNHDKILCAYDFITAVWTVFLWVMIFLMGYGLWVMMQCELGIKKVYNIWSVYCYFLVYLKYDNFFWSCLVNLFEAVTSSTVLFWYHYGMEYVLLLTSSKWLLYNTL